MALAASVIVPFVTARIMVEAGTSAMEMMSQRTELMEELKFNRTEAIRLAEKEERREEALRRESREDRKTFEDRILLLSAAVLACVVYKYM